MRRNPCFQFNLIYSVSCFQNPETWAAQRIPPQPCLSSTYYGQWGSDLCVVFFPSDYMGYLTSNNIFPQRKKEDVKENGYFVIPVIHSTDFSVSVSWKLWLNMTSYLFVQWLCCMEYHWLRNKHLVKHRATQTDLFSNTGAVSSKWRTKKLHADLLTRENKCLPDFNIFLSIFI